MTIRPRDVSESDGPFSVALYDKMGRELTGAGYARVPVLYSMIVNPILQEFSMPMCVFPTAEGPWKPVYSCGILDGSGRLLREWQIAYPQQCNTHDQMGINMRIIQELEREFG